MEAEPSPAITAMRQLYLCIKLNTVLEGGGGRGIGVDGMGESLQSGTPLMHTHYSFNERES